MNWILATRGAATVLRVSPFTETAIVGVHSVVYRPGVDLIPLYVGDATPLGSYARGLHRLAGVVYAYDADVAEALLGITAEVDLRIRYRARSGVRRRTIERIVFGGSSQVSFPAISEGLPPLIGVPFRAQLPSGTTLGDAVTDEAEE
jgi:hypothetical protein